MSGRQKLERATQHPISERRPKTEERMPDIYYFCFLVPFPKRRKNRMGQAFQKKARANLFSRGPEKKNYKVHVLLRIKGAFCFWETLGFTLRKTGNLSSNERRRNPNMCPRYQLQKFRCIWSIFRRFLKCWKKVPFSACLSTFVFM